MKKLTSYSKRVKYTYVKTTLATLFVSLFFLKGYAAFEKTGENYFHVFLNGNEIGGRSRQSGAASAGSQKEYRFPE